MDSRGAGSGARRHVSISDADASQGPSWHEQQRQLGQRHRARWRRQGRGFGGRGFFRGGSLMSLGGIQGGGYGAECWRGGACNPSTGCPLLPWLRCACGL